MSLPPVAISLAASPVPYAPIENWGLELTGFDPGSCVRLAGFLRRSWRADLFPSSEGRPNWLPGQEEAPPLNVIMDLLSSIDAFFVMTDAYPLLFVGNELSKAVAFHEGLKACGAVVRLVRT